MKVALVTGSSSGIGKATVDRLLADGWKVYGISRSQPSGSSDRFVWLECDLSKPAQLRAALSKVGEPEIHLLVSNAGVAFEEPATGVTEKSFHAMFSVNVLAPMLIVGILKEKLTQATIISVSSVSDRIVEKNFVLYGSSKAANTRFFDTLAAELPQAKVLVLLPDYVDTPMLRELQAGRDFNWSQTLNVSDLAEFLVGVTAGTTDLESGSNVILVNSFLTEDLESSEKLYGFNADTGELTKL